MLHVLLILVLLLQGPRSASFDSNKAWEHLRQLVAFGPRPAGSAAIEQSRTYIKNQLSAIGVAVTEQAWDDQTPTGRVHMVNLIATIPGASKNRLVIGGHYDTKKFPFRFVGANDGGSSAAFLIELARVLKARRNPLTIELLFLDGEEAVIDWAGTDHTYGSRHYVAEAKRDRFAGVTESVRARRHDWRSRSADQTRPQLDHVAHRHHLGRCAETTADVPTSGRTACRSRTIICRSWTPASPRST